MNKLILAISKISEGYFHKFLLEIIFSFFDNLSKKIALLYCLKCYFLVNIAVSKLELSACAKILYK